MNLRTIRKSHGTFLFAFSMSETNSQHIWHIFEIEKKKHGIQLFLIESVKVIIDNVTDTL